MKRIAAILVLLVLLFNLCGYRFVIDYLQQQHTKKFTARLDNAQYADKDLISIKTALSLPYYNATTDFERVDGSIQINGKAYNYVKRRIINDSLELLCLPDTEKQKLQTAKSDFFKITNDLQRPGGNKKSGNSIKTVLPEYCNAVIAFVFPSFHCSAQKNAVSNTPFISSLFAVMPEQPPETIHAFS